MNEEYEVYPHGQDENGNWVPIMVTADGTLEVVV